MSSPGIEPGSLQPQCKILTTVRTRPAKSLQITFIKSCQGAGSHIFFGVFVSLGATTMFLPKGEAAALDTRAAQQARREAYSRIELWVLDAIPVNLRRGAVVSVQEVACGDPVCAPIDTAIAILFER